MGEEELTERVATNLEPAEKKAFRVLAAQKDVSMAQLLRDRIRLYLDDPEAYQEEYGPIETTEIDADDDGE